MGAHGKVLYYKVTETGLRLREISETELILAESHRKGISRPGRDSHILINICFLFFLRIELEEISHVPLPFNMIV